MDTTDVEGIKSLVGLLKSSGDIVLLVAAWIMWRGNERLSKLEAAEAARTAKENAK